MSKLVWNASNQTVASLLQESAANAQSIFIAAAFFTQSGWSMIRDWLATSLAQGCHVELFVGTHSYLTEPSALEAAERLLRDKPDSALWICKQNSKPVFHPKLYVFKGEHEVVAVIGSANLTAGGLANNREVCCCLSDSVSSSMARDIDTIFEAYRADRKSIIKATVRHIRRYEVEWKRYHNRVKKAIREATNEIDALPSFNEVDLEQCLQDYQCDEASTYRHRENNYEIIPGLLDRLTEAKGRAEFMETYEQLVGKSGQSALWYSGGLYRNKNAVADGFAEVCKMVQAIAENPDASPAELFAFGLPYVKRVHRLGVNILTEVMHSYYPSRCPVLNNNSLGSLHHLGMAQFPDPQAFKPEDYQRFTEVIDYLRNRCAFQSMGQVDHFLNYVYHSYVKSSPEMQE